MNKSELGSYEDLLKYIIAGIFEKKGKDVINLDLRKLGYIACDNFVICHGDSGSQVRALAESVEDKVNMNVNIRVSHREGLENAHWILLDYGNVVVHIFHREAREYYKLEELWGDAVITPIYDD
jgi:ribosome-associated protein